MRRIGPGFTLVWALTLASCDQSATEPEQADLTLRPGEIGGAVAKGQPLRNVQTFDAMDFDVFSNRKWERLAESHTEDVIVTFADGTETHGLQKHRSDIERLVAHAPDTVVASHPIRIANGEWTAVTGILTGTFTRPMHRPDGSLVEPTGKRFSITMATIGHWKNGKMDHEWVFFDNDAYARQLGLR